MNDPMILCIIDKVLSFYTNPTDVIVTKAHQNPSSAPREKDDENCLELDRLS